MGFRLVEAFPTALVEFDGIFLNMRNSNLKKKKARTSRAKETLSKKLSRSNKKIRKKKVYELKKDRQKTYQGIFKIAGKLITISFKPDNPQKDIKMEGEWNLCLCNAQKLFQIIMEILCQVEFQKWI